MTAGVAAVRRCRRGRAPDTESRPAGPQPNDLDLRRVLAALDGRARYRYVTPVVDGIEGGYQVSSPCCSRNIDPQGGVIRIARLYYAEGQDEWLLYRRDHAAGIWVLHGCSRRLTALLEQLRDDPGRVFWS